VLSFYQSGLVSGGNLHTRYLRQRGSAGAVSGDGRSSLRQRLVQFLPGAMRLATAARFMLAGFNRQVKAARPDIVHGHYLSDYAFLAALSGRKPLVTTAWGSDVLRDPRESRVTKQIVEWVIKRSSLITYSADVVGEACSGLGARKDQLSKVILGVDSRFLDAVAGAPRAAVREPLIVSFRSLDRPMFNVDTIIEAMPDVLRHVPDARLLIGNSGRLQPDLQALASRIGVDARVEFIGMVDSDELARRLAAAAVYVSVPETDASSVTLLEAMAAGAYPIASDIPAMREWVRPQGGKLVPLRDVPALAVATTEALQSPERRQVAADFNRELIEREARWDQNMLALEESYRRLA
jgi:glycosyltransferase involved in cell wall biosynthesis